MDVQYEHLTKKFGSVVALNDFSLHVPDGEFLVLLGASGCGKTTALRCLAGLEKPSSGLIRIGGRVVNHLAPRERDIALVFQSYALYPQMTVGENIMYPLKVRKIPRAERLKMAQSVAQRLQIANLLDRRPAQLSGGQRQRVALARAIVRNPNVFLMDEPLSNLDAQLRVDMRAELKHLQETLGTTTIYVTHDQVEAMTMADRITVMRDGQLEQVGTPDEIYFTPQTMYVAKFVGSPSMNLLPVRFDAPARAFVGDGFTLAAGPFLERFAIDDAVSMEFVLGVRPEHLAVNFTEKPGSIAGKVYAVEPLGNETLLYASVGSALIITRADAMLRAEVHTPCWLEFRPEWAHMYDAVTQRRIPEKPGVAAVLPKHMTKT